MEPLEEKLAAAEERAAKAEAALVEAETAQSELAEKLEAKEAELAQALEVTEDLQKKLEAAKADQVVSDAIVVSHDKKKYTVTTASFQHEGKKYSAKDLLKNKELVAALVKKQVGFLEEIK